MPALKPLSTFDAVVDALGGKAEVARLTDNKDTAPRVWQEKTGRFPTRYYFTITAALAKRGYCAPRSLFGFHSKRRRPRRSKTASKEQRAA
jgi:hypothetical protein